MLRRTDGWNLSENSVGTLNSIYEGAFSKKSHVQHNARQAQQLIGKSRSCFEKSNSNPLTHLNNWLLKTWWKGISVRREQILYLCKWDLPSRGHKSSEVQSISFLTDLISSMSMLVVVHSYFLQTNFPSCQLVRTKVPQCQAWIWLKASPEQILWGHCVRLGRFSYTGLSVFTSNACMHSRNDSKSFVAPINNCQSHFLLVHSGMVSEFRTWHWDQGTWISVQPFNTRHASEIFTADQNSHSLHMCLWSHPFNKTSAHCLQNVTTIFIQIALQFCRWNEKCSNIQANKANERQVLVPSLVL